MSDFVDNYPYKFGVKDIAFDLSNTAYINVLQQAEKCVLERLALTKEEFAELTATEKTAALRSLGISGYTLNTDWSGNTLNVTLTFTTSKDNGKND